MQRCWKMGSRSTPTPLGKLLIVLLACSCYSSLLQTSYASAHLDSSISICQELAPSPLLEQFVDKLPIMKKIRISHGKQLTLGAYKIQQVSTPPLTFLLKIGNSSLGICMHISLSLTYGVAPFWRFYGGFSRHSWHYVNGYPCLFDSFLQLTPYDCCKSLEWKWNTHQ